MQEKKTADEGLRTAETKEVRSGENDGSENVKSEKEKAEAGQTDILPEKKEADKREAGSERRRLELLPYVMVSIFLLAAVLMVYILFRHYSNSLEGTKSTDTYDSYYVMITAENNSSFWDAVYKGAVEAGKKSNAYVEKMSENLYGDYSPVELIKMATASGADGIIVCSDESAEMCEQINNAGRNGIPVVTLLSDNSQSERCSFVGISYYNLGKIYGSEIAKIAKEKSSEQEMLNAVVLVDSTMESSGQNILISEINDILAGFPDISVNVSMCSVDDTNSFSVEESVSTLFTGRNQERPDIVVCLSDTETLSAYQMVVDYNLVGHVSILGYYDSDTIYKAIDRGAIYATVTVDTGQMGEYCVQALDEYRSLGNTSQYLTTDLFTIDKENVGEYLKEGDGNE